ncbi:uncharacterized protein LOC117099981 isoform X2 [Anneissia japonica]|uniref:uncharacterized protein LOC117099981 isoform X2 n=1 Tax=Anneissia japonica TaxID=1529436 RepID=UPI001425B42D|nr:uncharacterized protein LOC117099981 isoform X2 [Anneissia japonica]
MGGNLIQEEHDSMQNVYVLQCKYVDDIVKTETRLDNLMAELASNYSVKAMHTSLSRRSKKSKSSSSQIAELLANAEAAETRARYEKQIAEKEAELRTLKADSEAAVLRAKANASSAVFTDEGLYYQPQTTPDQTSNDHALLFQKHAHDQNETHQKQTSNLIPPTTPEPTTTPETVWTKTIDILARRSLPICKPQIYGGDPIMFLTWRRSFKAMVNKAKICATDELAYLAEFTKGPARILVDHYCQRHTSNPDKALEEAWQKLQEHFGHPSVITKRLKDTLNERSKLVTMTMRS